MGPVVTPSGRMPTVTLDQARTTAEQPGHPGACCYEWHVLCVGGRPLRGLEGPITAAPAGRDDWTSTEIAPEGAPLPPALRSALASYWEREAAFEHASVGAFARASLALLAAGAPPDLIGATHAAALDEIEHARLSYALASRYGGARRGPGPLPIDGSLRAPTLAELCAETLLDGCAGEAVAALALREGAALAADGAVRTVLERIAADEERHAELAFRTVAWAVRTGGAEVARRALAALESLRAEIAGGSAASGAGHRSDEPDLSAHGALGEAARLSIRQRALAEVVLPCAEALLSSLRA
jgi:hypothetical protein